MGLDKNPGEGPVKTTARPAMGGVEGLMGTLEKVTSSMESLVFTSRALEDNLYCAKVQWPVCRKRIFMYLKVFIFNLV